MNKQKELIIDGIAYIPKSSVSVSQAAKSLKGMPYAIVRTYSAGVFAGYIKNRKGQEVKLLKARRIWYWDGAASLSQLAVDGVSKPENCKFPCEVNEVLLLQVIEILPCSQKGQDSIASVAVWEQK